MGKTLKFDYYYGTEAEQFSFYRVPRLLIKDKMFSGLSCEAKLLYGLLLDRMSLSQANEWFDDDNRVYINYSLKSIAEDLGCSVDKAGRVIAELDSKKGIGLIDRVRKGQGKADQIYVKNFIIVQNNMEDEDGNHVNINESADYDSKKRQINDPRNRKSRLQETVKDGLKNPQDKFPKNRKSSSLEPAKSEPNYNNKNYTDVSQTDHIYSSAQNVDNSGWGREMNRYEIYEQLIKENIEYDYLVMDRYLNRNEIDELVSLMTEVVAVERETIRVNGTDYPYQVVKSSFLKLNSSHIRFVLECLSNNTTKITNMRSYLLTTLFNAPNIMSNYYRSEVNYDMYGGGWEEKGIIYGSKEDED